MPPHPAETASTFSAAIPTNSENSRISAASAFTNSFASAPSSAVPNTIPYDHSLASNAGTESAPSSGATRTIVKSAVSSNANSSVETPLPAAEPTPAFAPDSNLGAVSDDSIMPDAAPHSASYSPQSYSPVKVPEVLNAADYMNAAKSAQGRVPGNISEAWVNLCYYCPEILPLKRSTEELKKLEAVPAAYEEAHRSVNANAIMGEIPLKDVWGVFLENRRLTSGLGSQEQIETEVEDHW